MNCLIRSRQRLPTQRSSRLFRRSCRLEPFPSGESKSPSRVERGSVDHLSRRFVHRSSGSTDPPPPPPLTSLGDGCRTTHRFTLYPSDTLIGFNYHGIHWRAYSRIVFVPVQGSLYCGDQPISFFVPFWQLLAARLKLVHRLFGSWRYRIEEFADFLV